MGTSKAMERAYEDAASMVARARDMGFREWYAGSDEGYVEWVESRTRTLGEGRVRRILSRARDRHELAKRGIVGTGARQRTIDALVRAGLFERVDVRGVTICGTPVRVIS